MQRKNILTIIPIIILMILLIWAVVFLKNHSTSPDIIESELDELEDDVEFTDEDIEEFVDDFFTENPIYGSDNSVDF